MLVLVHRSEGGAAQFRHGVAERAISSLGPVCMSEARIIVPSRGRFVASVARAPSHPFAILHDSRCAQEPAKSQGCDSAQMKCCMASNTAVHDFMPDVVSTGALRVDLRFSRFTICTGMIFAIQLSVAERLAYVIF